ncbi:hypothetical protein DYB25_006455 [Aphanomyces astaci]|uniref:Uncharacterized protein n=1 Tax=Aphanomyces astaci TaxID=112090 RepID=A0A397BWR2_APHAT|nr:hypothetical protein DYB25_006455 [Aphanomyces astaci]RHY55459.1 hypothetical protein DYB34_002144 [Aphanomyces astaci]RHY60593.1 hypothetical protein DYB38_001123 [Aphanomyces astaci]RHY72949.1 hypothetical protein DYB30_002702 [Aphanomyces astaci]RHY83049.1 hypothetical protein DYB31_006637 [Aphanomyces astaci]
MTDAPHHVGSRLNGVFVVQGEGNTLFPPVKLPAPVKLSDSDMYLVHKMRVVSDRMNHLYPVAKTADSDLEVVHVTVPEVFFVPFSFQTMLKRLRVP